MIHAPSTLVTITLTVVQTKDEFFRSLQRAASDVPQPHRSDEEDRTIVILTTPSFATWIEDVDFLGRVVNTLSKGCDSLNHLETTAAVVDGLRPAREAADQGATSQSAEGFSFMITSRKSSAQPCHLEILRGLAANPDTFSGLRFNFLRPSFTDKHALLQCTVPLANTLFSNGRTSTLLVGRWIKDLPNKFVSHSLEYKEAYTVFTEEFRFSQSSSQIPLEGLTKPRRIVAGMGNIVRQLEGDGGKPLPASTELEESVVAYLNKRNLPQQQVSVWALVIPESVLRKGRVESIDPSRLWPLRYILQKKASLHRVCKLGFLNHRPYCMFSKYLQYLAEADGVSKLACCRLILKRHPLDQGDATTSTLFRNDLLPLRSRSRHWVISPKLGHMCGSLWLIRGWWTRKAIWQT